MYIFKLRPHHALCIQFFEGKGYSDEFTCHMKEIVYMMKQDAEIEITFGKDDICAECPNLINDLCTEQEKVCRYDKKVMEFCNFYEGQILSASVFLGIAKRDIINKGKIKEVCGDCAWKCGKCKKR